MDRLPLFVGLALVAFGLLDWRSISTLTSLETGRHVNWPTARAEIPLVRAENRVFMRHIRQVQQDHRGLYRIVEEAYFGVHPETKRKKDEKAIQGVGARPGR